MTLTFGRPRRLLYWIEYEPIKSVGVQLNHPVQHLIEADRGLSLGLGCPQRQAYHSHHRQCPGL